MSRNFELLQQIGKEQEMLYGSLPIGRPSSPDAKVDSNVDTMESPSVLEAMLPVGTPNLSLQGVELEEVTKLVQNIFLVPGNGAPRMVVFTGSDPGDGCSWICAHAAEVLASQVSGTVCLVDANLRSPSLHEMFSMPNHHGLSDALRQPGAMRNFVHRLSMPNLSLLTCGSQADDAHSLLASDRMRLRLTELRGEFDYILIDSPALSASSDGIALSSAADGVVLVLKANSSRRETARRDVENLRAAKSRVLGAVLNQRTFPIPQSIYNKL